jgi:hypothetical protein
MPTEEEIMAAEDEDRKEHLKMMGAFIAAGLCAQGCADPTVIARDAVEIAEKICNLVDS